jgi:fanconi anemia group J protein
MKVLLFSERLDVKPEPSKRQVWCLFYLTNLIMYIEKTNKSNWGYLRLHLKASKTWRNSSNSISPPPVMDLESFAYKPLKKDPVPLNSRRSKVSYLLPLLLSFAVLLVITFPEFEV